MPTRLAIDNNKPAFRASMPWLTNSDGSHAVVV